MKVERMDRLENVNFSEFLLKAEHPWVGGVCGLHTISLSQGEKVNEALHGQSLDLWSC